MKIIKTILLVISILIIIIGMYFLGSRGLRFTEGGMYTANNILEVAMPYIEKVVLSTILILIYLTIRYSKIGIVKVFATSLLTILGTQALIISILTIANLTVDRMFFSILLMNFVATILILTANFEEKLKTL